MTRGWRDLLRRLHRAISLLLIAIWLVQIASGVLLVFHRDIDDLASPGSPRPVDIPLLARGIERLERHSDRTAVTGAFLTSPTGRHFDVFLEDGDGTAHLVRLDGQGTELLRRPMDTGVAAALHALNRVHRSLAAGTPGEWLIRASGLFLLTNLMLGLRLAWPARGQWRLAMRGAHERSTDPARSCTRHRALGLWLAGPALTIVACGTLLAFERPLVRGLGLQPAPVATAAASSGQPAGLVQILTAATHRAPGAELTAVIFPHAPGRPIQVRFLGHTELRQTHGETRVYVDPTTAQVLHHGAPKDFSLASRFLQSLVPIHTGQAGGWLGRTLVAITGIALLVLASLGIRLWWIRRRRRQAALPLHHRPHHQRRSP